MSGFRLINVGFGNMVSVGRIVAVISPESAPVKRMVQDARARGAAVDATCGRRTRAVIMTDCDTLILSALQPETLANRIHSFEQAAALESPSPTEQGDDTA